MQCLGDDAAFGPVDRAQPFVQHDHLFRQLVDQRRLVARSRAGNDLRIRAHLRSDQVRQAGEGGLYRLQLGVVGVFGHETFSLSRRALSPATYQRWAVLAEQPATSAICSNVRPPQSRATIVSR